MGEDEHFLREYELIVELFISEGRTAWELVSIYSVLQIGLASAVVVLLPEKVPWSLFQILFSLGMVSSVTWGFIQYRAKMWRENWLLAGLRMERQLADKGLILDPRFSIFEIENRARMDNWALELEPDDRDLSHNNIRYRDQRWYEKGGALRLAHWGMLLLAIIWGSLLIVSFHYRFIV